MPRSKENSKFSWLHAPELNPRPASHSLATIVFEAAGTLHSCLPRGAPSHEAHCAGPGRVVARRHAGTFVLAIVADYCRCRVMLTFVSLGVRSRSHAGRQESVAPKAGPIRTVEAPRFDLILASKWRVFEISALRPARIRRSNRLNTCDSVISEKSEMWWPRFSPDGTH
jgi:hypothetical protein